MTGPAVAVLHPGRMGAAVAAQLRRGGVRVLWCSVGRSAATARRAEEAGFEPVGSLAEVVAVADIVLSICPPEFAEDLATSVAGHGFGGLYVEANAISPGRCVRMAGLLTA
ncbi:MAG: NAD(P)-binding domain-containing protein, partial [Nocardioides sp.]